MEAKDTVMSGEVVSPKFPDYIPCAVWDVLNTQAEISFKIGKTAGVAESLLPAVKAIEKSQKAGIREVVKWVERHKKVTETELYIGRATYTHYDIPGEQWQSQKKEWGIDE